MELGPIGIWTATLDSLPIAGAQAAVAELESLGYAAVWFPEAFGRDAFVASTLYLAGSNRIVVATGVANLWARDAMAAAAAHKTITSAYPDRFLLGLGVSHQAVVDGFRGHVYQKPLSTMRAYLEAMDASVFRAAPPPAEPVRVLAALQPKMLALSAEKASGAHPYFVPLEHTVDARRILGEGPLLCTEQAVVLETDPTRARQLARGHTHTYTTVPNYQNSLRHYGFGDDDFAHAGSDRLVDAVVAWGDLDTVVARVQAHLDAGADHVCVQVIDDNPGRPPTAAWRELAAALPLGT
jgi:probable F420-dependent oxidoreductase